MENDLYRRCIELLKSWTSAASRGVMVLRGARQVGKTTLIRLLAKELGLTLIEVNLEDTPSFAGMLDKRSNAKEILDLLLLEKGVTDNPENVLFFFDEIQELPGFYEYLRYFKELAHEYKVIAAGSLLELEIQKEKKGQGPSGRVEFAYLDPMTFEEFILAANPVAHKKLTNLDLLEPIGSSLHGIFYSLYKQYMVCGGMPAAVEAFVNGEGVLRVDKIKNNLLTGYINDFADFGELSGRKYDPELLELIFRQVYGNPCNTMTLSKLAPGFRADKIRGHLEILIKSKLIRRSVHTHENKPPLLNGADKHSHKLFALDVGLCYSYMDILPQEVYGSGDINSVAEGAMAEQFAAQTIQSVPPHYKAKSLYHWERKKKNAVSEVDFVTTLDSIIVPIECKSGHSNKMESLKIMLGTKAYSLALRLYAGDIGYGTIKPRGEQIDLKEVPLISMPHYMLERFIHEFIKISAKIGS
ncbi:MAG: putative AAA+ superfamily ATPase [Paraglaciecola sp.]